MYRGFDKPNKTYFSSLESHEKPNISTASFRLPGFVDAMKDSVTVEGITYKDVIGKKIVREQVYETLNMLVWSGAFFAPLRMKACATQGSRHDHFPEGRTLSANNTERVRHLQQRSWTFRLPAVICWIHPSECGFLAVALSSGSIMRIPKFLLDPRRPMIPTQAEREEGLIPYAPELPMVTENIINYYKKAYRIRGLVTEVAGLESLSLVFAFGLGKKKSQKIVKC